MTRDRARQFSSLYYAHQARHRRNTAPPEQRVPKGWTRRERRSQRRIHLIIPNCNLVLSCYPVDPATARPYSHRVHQPTTLVAKWAPLQWACRYNRLVAASPNILESCLSILPLWHFPGAIIALAGPSRPRFAELGIYCMVHLFIDLLLEGGLAEPSFHGAWSTDLPLGQRGLPAGPRHWPSVLPHLPVDHVSLCLTFLFVATSWNP